MMHPSELLADAKQHARIDGDDDNETLTKLLHAATGDVLAAAGRDVPEDLAGLPFDLIFAICDQAAMLYDARGGDTERPVGLSLAASRIAARYRGVRACSEAQP